MKHETHLVHEGAWVCARCGAMPGSVEWLLRCAAPEVSDETTSAPREIDWLAINRQASGA